MKTQGIPLICTGNQWKSLIFIDSQWKINGVSRKSNENHPQASSSKSLINLSNTACGPGSDKKLRQLPGAPGNRRGPPGAFYGYWMGFYRKSMKPHRGFVGFLWNPTETWEGFTENSLKLMEIHWFAMKIQWQSRISTESQWGFQWIVKEDRKSVE